MSTGFKAFLGRCQQRVEHALEENLGPFAGGAATRESQLEEAVRYSLLGGGKRLRPVLVLAAAEAVRGDSEGIALEQVACAVEYIHAYSLVHDDLPAMDNDALRRGKPTCHRKFGEATAILVGDLLQCRAFELLSTIELQPQTRLDLITTLGAAAGATGMVAGQAIDLAAVARELDIDQLETMHRLKTGALIRAAAGMGAIAAGADADQRAALERYAAAIGLAFQVQDDVLDVTGATAVLGKQQGADQARGKPTYPQLLGLEEARHRVQRLHEEARAALAPFGERAANLRALSDWIASRAF